MPESANDQELVHMARFRVREAGQRLVHLAASASDPLLVEQLHAAAEALRVEERALGRHYFAERSLEGQDAGAIGEDIDGGTS